MSRTSIASDVQYLREQAKLTIREYVTEHLPEQYQVCLVALDSIIKCFKLHKKYTKAIATTGGYSKDRYYYCNYSNQV
jgi:hypothetical protein